MKFRTLCMTGLLVSACVGTHATEAWPGKTITLVVPFPPGGGTDIVARAIAQNLSDRLKTTVLVDNRAGAASALGAQMVARAPADGHTLLISGASTFSINPAIRRNLRYDPVKDFAPIALVGKVPLLMTVNAASPYKTVADLVSAAKARPGALNYATHGSGSAPHLAASLFSLAAGLQMTEISYRGSSPAMLALMAGEVEVAMDTAAAVAPQVKAGKLRAIANFGLARSPSMPTVPTMTDLNLPEASFEGWFGVAAPSGTPPDVLRRLTKEVLRTMADPDVKAQLNAQSIEPTAGGAEEMRKLIDLELARYRALAVRARIQAE